MKTKEVIIKLSKEILMLERARDEYLKRCIETRILIDKKENELRREIATLCDDR